MLEIWRIRNFIRSFAYLFTTINPSEKRLFTKKEPKSFENQRILVLFPIGVTRFEPET